MKHNIARITITGAAPLIQSRFHQAAKLENKKESSADYDERTFREKCNTDERGEVVIPAFAIKNALTSAAKRGGDKVEGKGNKKWGKIIETGIMVINPAKLGVLKEDVGQVQIFCSAKGWKNDGTRFPHLKWCGPVEAVFIQSSSSGN